MMNEEIALFIDFENIRYSLLNVRHREPDPQELIGVARRFGTVMVARAYADWTRQPDFFKGSLTAAMIDRVDCPAKLRDRFRANAPSAPYASYGSYPSAQSARQFDQESEDADESDLLDEQASDEMPESGESSGDQIEAEAQPEPSENDDDPLDDEYESENEADEQPQRYPQASPRPYMSGGYQSGSQSVTTQSSVDLNMLMDIIETVFDRPSINTYVLMTGDRDFTRICARLKLRLNKRVIIVGVPGTVSRDLISAASQFIPLGGPMGYGRAGAPRQEYVVQGPVEPDEPGFIQFLDYIDTHWAWRTIGGVANFIGDPFNPKNRFRGRLTRDTARDLLRDCIDRGILIATTDPMGGESLRLNRSHPAVEGVLSETAAQ
ncbi:MAG TPA: NYN domain-containing protein [Ktedonobacterales bacterium]